MNTPNNENQNTFVAILYGIGRILLQVFVILMKVLEYIFTAISQYLLNQNKK